MKDKLSLSQLETIILELRRVKSNIKNNKHELSLDIEVILNKTKLYIEDSKR